MISPATVLLAPAAAASIGMTDSSRKKLVSDVNSARNDSARRQAQEPGPVRPAAGPGRAAGWYGAHSHRRYEATGTLIRSNFMAIEWSGLGPELLRAAGPVGGPPLRAQLEASLREAIRDGRLHGGERLPSSRELARGLGVSRGMVQECYGQLLAEGYLTSRGGSATRVADIRERPARARFPGAAAPARGPAVG